jgi:hypothetical protein
MLLILFLWSCVSCQPKPVPNTVEVPGSVHCDPATAPCFSVSRAILEEHGALLAENIRLKAALKFCTESRDQNR